MKFCTRCKEEKNLECFGKNRREADGLHYYCKECVINIKYQHQIDDPDYYKRYAETNKDKLGKYQQEYRQKKKQNASLNNKPNVTVVATDVEESKRKKEEYRLKRSSYFKNKYQSDQQFRLKKQFESRLNRLFKDNDDTDTTINLIGCTITQFKAYLEPLFLPTMSWDNYGEAWSFDRVISFYDFDLSNEEDAKRCFHYTNVQPLFMQTKINNEVEYVGNANKNKYTLQNLPMSI